MADFLFPVVIVPQAYRRIARSTLIGVLLLSLSTVSIADNSGSFDIAVQSAEVSLNEFALQAERSILVVRRGAGAGATTRRRHGEFTVDAALTH